MTWISSVAAAYDRRTTKRLSRRLGVSVDAEECKMKRSRAALGFRVKSGWAVAILISGSVRSPHLCDSCVINLSDPCNPETRQPYHADGNARDQRGQTKTPNAKYSTHDCEISCRSSPATYRQGLHNSSCRICGRQPDRSRFDRQSAYSRACVGGTPV